MTPAQYRKERIAREPRLFDGVSDDDLMTCAMDITKAGFLRQNAILELMNRTGAKCYIDGLSDGSGERRK